MNDELIEAVTRLCEDIEQPENNNAMFAGKAIWDMLEAGYALADIETALRNMKSRMHLLALPMTENVQSEAVIFHPNPRVEDETLRFYLWIGLNGPEEALDQLRAEGMAAGDNLRHLCETGLLRTRTPKDSLGEDPALRDLLGYLLLDAPNWTARGIAIRDHLDVLRSDEAIELLERLAVEIPSARDLAVALKELTLSTSRDGWRVAAQTCAPLVLEALIALLEAPSWKATGDVYAVYDDVLSGDLAAERLGVIGQDPKYSRTERALIDAHVRFLDDAWEVGIDRAVDRASSEFPAKLGRPTPEDHVVAYSRARNLESARDLLQTYTESLLGADDATVWWAIDHSDVEDEVERIGLLESAREVGVDAAFHVWSELRSLQDPRAKSMRRLRRLATRGHGCVRDRALELLLARCEATDDQKQAQAVAAELVERRSTLSRPSRRPIDLVNLGIICSKLGEQERACALFVEARTSVNRLRKPAIRALQWIKIALFYRDYGDDEDVPAAVHYFRLAAAEFEAAEDVLSMAFCFEMISSLYRMRERYELAAVYSTLALQATEQLEGSENGSMGSFDEVYSDVMTGAALTEVLLGNVEDAVRRSRWLVENAGDVLTGNRRLAVERVLCVASIEAGDLETAQELGSAWRSARETRDWSRVVETLLGLVDRIGVQDAEDGLGTATTAADVDPAGAVSALERLGMLTAEAAADVRAGSAEELARLLMDALTGVQAASGFSPSGRLLGGLEAASWVTQAQRTAGLVRQEVAAQEPRLPLPPGSPWANIVERYAELGVWEYPDLSIYGPIIDRWGLSSRFDHIRINAPALSPGALHLYFCRTDPEGHLGGAYTSVIYVAEHDLILCWLPYLEDLFRTGRYDWSGEEQRIREALYAAGWPPEAASLSANMVRARARVLVEWIIAHEMGHAHLSHGRLSDDTLADRAALEDEADAFFFELIREDHDVGEFLQSFFGQLNFLYGYCCEVQLGRAPTPEETATKALALDATPDMTGHRPVVFRAVSLIRSILAANPELDSTGYIDEFAASIGAG